MQQPRADGGARLASLPVGHPLVLAGLALGVKGALTEVRDLLTVQNLSTSPCNTAPQRQVRPPTAGAPPLRGARRSAPGCRTACARAHRAAGTCSPAGPGNPRSCKRGARPMRGCTAQPVLPTPAYRPARAPVHQPGPAGCQALWQRNRILQLRLCSSGVNVHASCIPSSWRQVLMESGYAALGVHWIAGQSGVGLLALFCESTHAELAIQS